MPEISFLKPFRSLARTGRFSRNVDDLFKDFFLAPMSLDFTATGQSIMDAADVGQAQHLTSALAGANGPDFPDQLGVGHALGASF